MAKFMSVKGTLSRLQGGLAKAKDVASRPLAETRGMQVAKILRYGVRGISEQFANESEYRGSQSRKWTKSRAFGNKPAPRKTMDGNGTYRAAWLGGPGSIESITPSVVTVGIERSVFPQVAIHQGPASVVTIKPKAKTANGKDWKMRFYLGLTYGVWMTKARLERGLAVHRRRISVSKEVMDSVRWLIKNNIRSRVKGFETRVQEAR